MLIILFSAHLILDLNLTLVWDLFGLRKSKTRNVLLFGVNFQWKISKISKIRKISKFLWEQKFYVGTLLFGTCMFLRHVFNMKISAGNEPYYCIWLLKNSQSHFMVYKIEGLQNRIFMISPKWNRFRVIRWYVSIITSIWTYHWSINHVISVTWLSREFHQSRDLDPIITLKRPFRLKILKSTQKKTAKKHQNQQFAQWLELIPWEHSLKERMNLNYDIIDMTHKLWVTS